MPSRILLADDSPHAQRMGERILREEGYEVVTVTDGKNVILRMDDVRPDVVLLDAFLPDRSGYDLCRDIKALPGHKGTAIVLVGGLLEPVNEDQAKAAGADATLKKPFEATVVVETVRSLIAQSENGNGDSGSVIVMPVAEIPAEPLSEEPAAPSAAPVAVAEAAVPAVPAAAVPVPAPVPAPVPVAAAAAASPDPEMVRAAVTVALDRAMPALVDEITARVIRALSDPAPGSSIKQSE